MTYRIISDATLDRVIGIAEQAIDTYPDCYTVVDLRAMENARSARTPAHPFERDAAVKCALRMEGDSSSFAHHLGTLFLASDGDNRARLLAAFASVFETFGEGA